MAAGKVLGHHKYHADYATGEYHTKHSTTRRLTFQYMERGE